MMPLGKRVLSQYAQFSQVASLVAILMNVFSNVLHNSNQFMKTARVRSANCNNE